MRQRTKPIIAYGVASVAAFFVACLLPSLAALSGCGSFRGAAGGTTNLQPNYLDEVLIGVRPGPVDTYRMKNGSAFQQRFVQDGIDLWNRATLTEGKEIRRDDASGVVSVEFVGRDFVGAGNLGLSYVEVSPEGIIVSARMLFLSDPLIPPTRLQAVGSHEAGHAILGIRGHPTSRPSIMADLVPFIDFLHTLDVNTARAIARHAIQRTALPIGRRVKGRKLDNGNTLYIHATKGDARDGPLSCAED